jgi:hypothetical protein
MLQAGLNADFPSSPTAAGAAVAAVKAAAKDKEAAALPGSSLWPIKCKAQVIGPSFAYVSPAQVVLVVPAQGHISIVQARVWTADSPSCWPAMQRATLEMAYNVHHIICCSVSAAQS